MFLLVVLTCWKRNTFKISLKIHFKKRKIICETFFSPSFDVLHSSTIVYMDHTELIFQDLFFYCTKKVAENHNQFVRFHHGVKHTSWCLLIPWSSSPPKQGRQLFACGINVWRVLDIYSKMHFLPHNLGYSYLPFTASIRNSCLRAKPRYVKGTWRIKKKQLRHRCNVTCDIWHATCDTWHVTCETWKEVNILSKCHVPSS